LVFANAHKPVERIILRGLQKLHPFFLCKVIWNQCDLQFEELQQNLEDTFCDATDLYALTIGEITVQETTEIFAVEA
jgi:hypothetical protein